MIVIINVNNEYDNKCSDAVDDDATPWSETLNSLYFSGWAENNNTCTILCETKARRNILFQVHSTQNWGGGAV